MYERIQPERIPEKEDRSGGVIGGKGNG